MCRIEDVFLKDTKGLDCLESALMSFGYIMGNNYIHLAYNTAFKFYVDKDYVNKNIDFVKVITRKESKEIIELLKVYLGVEMIVCDWASVTRENANYYIISVDPFYCPWIKQHYSRNHGKHYVIYSPKFSLVFDSTFNTRPYHIELSEISACILDSVVYLISCQMDKPIHVNYKMLWNETKLSVIRSYKVEDLKFYLYWLFDYYVNINEAVSLYTDINEIIFRIVASRRQFFDFILFISHIFDKRLVNKLLKLSKKCYLNWDKLKSLLVYSSLKRKPIDKNNLLKVLKEIFRSEKELYNIILNSTLN